jgi:hypothetical protein
MKKKSSSQSAFFNPRALIGLFFCFAGVLIALFAFGAPQETAPQAGPKSNSPFENTMTRQDLVEIYQSIAPAAFVPPACVAGSEIFTDVPASNPFCPWVEELFRQGITGGCGGGKFCPGDPVSRQQMAVFIVRALQKVPETLPSGATLRGVYTWAGHYTTGFRPTAPISYQFPLASPPSLNVIPIGGGGTAACPGSSADPQAAPGQLCVYQTRNDSGTPLVVFNQIAGGRFGAVLFASVVGPSTDFEFDGTWAVTAP